MVDTQHSWHSSAETRTSSCARTLRNAILLRPCAFAGVSDEQPGLWHAFVTVCFSGAAMTLGMHGHQDPATVLTGMAFAVPGWILWSWIAFVTGAALSRPRDRRTPWARLLRTSGFATAPGVIGIAGVVPPLAGIAVFVAAIWTAAALFVAVRTAFDHSSTRALATSVVCWTLFSLIVSGAIALLPGS